MKDLRKTQIYAEHPYAEITEEMFGIYHHRSEYQKLEERARILARMCIKQGYNQQNISRMGVIDVARSSRTRKWLKYEKLKEKLLAKTIRMVE